MIAGVDGYKGGWIGIIDRGDRGTEVRHFETFSDLLHDRAITLIVIDIPIGLLPRGARQCDQEARKFLGRPRQSSVFPAPIRPMLRACNLEKLDNIWKEACRIRWRIEGKKCSKQVAAILPKIHEVDQAMTPEQQNRIREGHPEVSFAAMNGNRPMRHRKLTQDGRQERVDLLVKYFHDIREQIAACTIRGAITDVIDAYACLWTARRIAHHQSQCYPSSPPFDERGLRAEIIF